MSAEIIARNGSPYLNQVVLPQLPIEIVSQILSYLPNKDLMPLREVNQEWKQEATRICRRRFLGFHVRCGVNDENRIIAELLSDFGSCLTPPWSSLDASNTPSSTFWKVCDDFGDRLLEVSYKVTSWTSVMKFLRTTPNLINLDLGILPPKAHRRSDDGVVAEVFSFAGQENLKLDGLKSLSLLYANNLGAQFLAFLLSSGVQLTFLKINFAGMPLSSEICQLLRNIPRVSFEGTYTLPLGQTLPMLSQMEIPAITEIRLNSIQIAKNFDNYFEPARNLLIANAKHLRKLDLDLRILPRKASFPTFEIPIPRLPALKELRIYSKDYETLTFPTSPLTLLQSTQVPILEIVRLAGNFTSPKVQLNLFGESHVDSVRELVIKSYGIVYNDDWNQVFPNLKKLRLSIWNNDGTRNDEELLKVFTCTKLEELVLNMANVGDINVLLSGVNRPAVFYTKPEAEIARLRQEYGKPCLLSLKVLRKLEIVTLGDGKIRDCGAYLSLLQIQPLTSLSLSCAMLNISEECEGKLRARHHRFIRT